MSDVPHYPSDIAFTDSVKAQQALHGSRRAYARMEEGTGWQTAISPNLKAFIEAQRSFYLATSNAEGQPYIQHRGGAPGFLRVLDEHTLGFADYSGNRQYITLGNLAENPKVHLFLMDYAARRRVKLWGIARVVEADAPEMHELATGDGRPRVERGFLITVSTWDVNCPKFIPQRIEAEDVAAALEERDRRIAALEAEVRSLRG